MPSTLSLETPQHSTVFCDPAAATSKLWQIIYLSRGLKHFTQQELEDLLTKPRSAAL